MKTRNYNLLKNGRVVCKIRVSDITCTIARELINLGYVISGNYKGV